MAMSLKFPTNPSNLPSNMRDTTSHRILDNPAVLCTKGPWEGSTVSYDDKERAVLEHPSGAVMKLWRTSETVGPKKDTKKHKYSNRKNVDDI